ncbi:MAG: hypothetical protein HKN09_07400, partial [Saprospiraceae bacterium]|nr:hypothetical protein [Saprospiraceae bacterium]
MRTLLTTILLHLTLYSLGAQHSVNVHRDSLEVHNIKEWFRSGSIHGHFRNYFMTTVNSGSLNDYTANATGGALAFSTAEYYGFSIGVKGIFTFNTYDNELLRIDEASNKFANWETELFDLTRPEEKKDLDRLEELYLKYAFGNNYISYGKLDINKGPLLKRRDGRMKPFVY